ncbi:MAG: hypothetical protein ACKPA9_12295, partial [Microcystis sp.]
MSLSGISALIGAPFDN